MSSKQSFVFKAFDEKSFQSTAEVWTQEALNGLAFPSEIEQLMAWAARHLAPQEGASVAYGIFSPDSKVAVAICEIVVTRKSVRSKWIKMLRVRLRPQIDDALNSTSEASSAGLRDALEIFIQATLGTFKLGKVEQANTIKIYGRTRQQADFLRFLGVELEKLPHNPMMVAMEGKFLVVQSA